MSRSPRSSPDSRSADTMHGSTIVVNTTFNDGHRIKRIKLEQPRGRRDSDLIRSLSNRRSVNRSTNGYPTLSNGAVDTDAEPHAAKSSSSLETLSPQTAQTVIAGTIPQAFNSARPISTLTGERAALQQKVGYSDAVSSNNQNIDFTTAPSDPIELAWWVAQQISHFQTDVPDSSQPLFEDRPNTTSDNPPEGGTRYSDEDVQLSELAEKEKLREDNRERKKRWRESNTEKNKDNDLRCRINKRAKTKFGPEPSAEKAAYVEIEFNKRRTKREAKQRARALETGEFPSFAIPPELIDRSFSAQNPNASAEVQVAGDLLMNTLFGSSSSRPRAGKPEASNSLKTALENGSLDSRPFVEALQIMAKNTDLMRGINARLNSERYDEEGDGISGAENGHQLKQSASTRADSSTSDESMLNHQSAEIIKALNAATALLNEMADTKTYASPYGNPPPKKGMDDSRLTKSDGSAETSSKQATNGHGLDQSQIDALLALANGGSLTDDDDDKTIADPDEFDTQELDSGGTAQSDSDIIATLQRYISHLMAERSGTENAGESKRNQLKTTNSDPYGAQSVRDQATVLQSLFAQAGVSINTIMPREQGQATSQLYAHLSSRARSSTPAKSINSTQARSYGSTAQMHQRMLANPDVIAQAQQPHQRPLQSINSNGNMMGLSIRTRTAEEVKKIKSYGYPPLPGQKIGVWGK